jgi:hypothetical protein
MKVFESFKCLPGPIVPFFSWSVGSAVVCARGLSVFWSEGSSCPGKWFLFNVALKTRVSYLFWLLFFVGYEKIHE